MDGHATGAGLERLLPSLAGRGRGSGSDANRRVCDSVDTPLPTSTGGGASDSTGSRPWNRFARWPLAKARLVLVGFVLLLVASATVPITVNRGSSAVPPPPGAMIGLPSLNPKARPRDDDLRLYDTAIARISRGENYYHFIVSQHRRAHYPVRPAIAVRLPTLAYLDAWAGLGGQIVAAVALLTAVLAAWWRRLGVEPGARAHRAMAMALLFCGTALGLNRYYFVLHELWSGMLLALSFGLHRPDGNGGRWRGAWCAAALALAIRELALPFVLLMGAFAIYRRAWREAFAWAALVTLFAAAWSWHLALIHAQTLPRASLGPSGIAMRGLAGALGNIALSRNLRFLPHWLAGPWGLLMLLGWAGWRSAAGSFGVMLFAGYGVAFMIVGRADNFYWGAMVAPCLFPGLAFAPMALRTLMGTLRPAALYRGEQQERGYG